MGWSGYGKYDGDGTATVQMSMVELAGFKRDIPLDNGDILAELWTWNVGRASLSKDVVDAVFSKWRAIQKSLRNPTYYDREDTCIFDMMAADFFMSHGVLMPEDLQARIGASLDYLLSDEHAGDFRDPSKRRRVLRAFKAKAVNWE